MPESVLMGQLHPSKACWELWLSDDQPHSDYNGQWQRALCILAVLQSSQPNPQRNEKNRKMYAIKQIKICAEYRDMLPRSRLDLSGTPGLRPIGFSPGSWQTSLGLGSMSRYSAQILICIWKYIHGSCRYGHFSKYTQAYTSASHSATLWWVDGTVCFKVWTHFILTKVENENIHQVNPMSRTISHKNVPQTGIQFYHAKQGNQHPRGFSEIRIVWYYVPIKTCGSHCKWLI